MQIAVLGVCAQSTYHQVHVPGAELILFDKQRNMLNFDFSMPVICHPPCQQWSRNRTFAHPDEVEKSLAFWCLLAVTRCGGILEHPHGSLFMRNHVGYSRCVSVNQSWFGFPARKSTLLYCNRTRLESFPLSFDLPATSVTDLHSSVRSRSTLSFNTWLVESVVKSFSVKSKCK